MRAPRFRNWPERLANYLNDHQATPFEWGKCDCCLLAADAIKVMTGVDPAVDLRGKYDSALSAARLIHAQGGFEALIQRLAAQLEAQEITPAFAQRGDVALVKSELLVGGYGLAVVALSGKLVVPGEAGLLYLPISEASKVWRI